MNKSKKFLLISGLLFASGAVLYLVAFIFGARVTGVSLDSAGLHVHSPQISSGSYYVTYEEKTVDLDAFTSLEIDVDFADVIIVPSDKFALSYKNADTSVLTYDVVNGHLKLLQSPKNALKIGGTFMLFGGFDYFDSGVIDNTMTLYIPAGTQLSELTARLGSVDLTASGLSADQMDVKLDFGSVELQDLKAKDCSIDLESADMKLTDGKFSSLNLSDNFGSLTLTNISADQPSVIDLESADMTMNDCTFGDLEFSSTFGYFDGTNVTADGLNCVMESGDADLKTFTCSSLYMKSTFGSIDLLLTRPLQDYTYSLSTSFGTIKVDGKDLGTAYKPLFDELSDHSIEIKGDSCDITIDSTAE